MRRGWVGLCCLAALVAAAAFAADDAEKSPVGPSLEYRPPKPILPEPKGPTPAPPVAIFRESFGSFGIGRGSFDKPLDVALGANGRVYVLDSGNSRVQLFDDSENFLLEWGSQGRDERRCQFSKPSAIFVIPEARIDCSNPQFSRYKCEIVLVLDTGEHRIQWFKVPITEGSRDKLPNFPCGHQQSLFQSYKDPDDQEAVGDYGDWGEYGIADGKFNRPLDIVFEGGVVKGVDYLLMNFRILDAGNERIQRFQLCLQERSTSDCARRFLGYRENCWNKLCLAEEDIPQDTISNLTGTKGDLRGLVSLAWSHEESFDYLYLLGTGCSLQKFKLANLPVLDTTWPAVAPESGLCVPARVRYDSEKEYVYVLDSGNGLLSTFHRKGNFIGAMRGANRTFRRPGGFALRPQSGEFTVADTGNDLVQKFTLR